MYVQIASTDIHMATQNCIQNRATLQNYLLNLSKIFENIFVAVDH